jgi:hypothetical protein
MRRFTIFPVLAIALAACTPTTGSERVTAGESVDIASAGAQISVQRSVLRLVDHLAGGNPRHHAAQLLADFLDLVGVVVAAGALKKAGPRRFPASSRARTALLDVVRTAFIRALVSS